MKDEIDELWSRKWRLKWCKCTHTHNNTSGNWNRRYLTGTGKRMQRKILALEQTNSSINGRKAIDEEKKGKLRLPSAWGLNVNRQLNYNNNTIKVSMQVIENMKTPNDEIASLRDSYAFPIPNYSVSFSQNNASFEMWQKDAKAWRLRVYLPRKEEDGARYALPPHLPCAHPFMTVTLWLARNFKSFHQFHTATKRWRKKLETE